MNESIVHPFTKPAAWVEAVKHAVRAVHRWVTRPVTNPQPLLGGVRVTRGADTYGKHDRSVGEDTVPLGELLARMGFTPHPRPRREPPLFGTDPIDLWTHPERYGPPVPPPEMVATAAAVTTDYSDTEVSA